MKSTSSIFFWLAKTCATPLLRLSTINPVTFSTESITDFLFCSENHQNKLTEKISQFYNKKITQTTKIFLSELFLIEKRKCHSVAPFSSLSFFCCSLCALNCALNDTFKGMDDEEDAETVDFFSSINFNNKLTRLQSVSFKSRLTNWKRNTQFNQNQSCPLLPQEHID